MRRMMVLLGGVLLVAAACGGGSTEDGGNGGDQPTATQPADDGGADNSASEDQAPPPTESAGGEGPSTATVTIGDMVYEASSEGALVAQCLPNFFGIMSVQLPLVNGGDGSIQIVALHEGTDPVEMEQDNQVIVIIGDAVWVAEPDEFRFGLAEAPLSSVSRVESVEFNGSTVTGTATFVGRENNLQEWVSMTGTFEATCGEERTS